MLIVMTAPTGEATAGDKTKFGVTDYDVVPNILHAPVRQSAEVKEDTRPATALNLHIKPNHIDQIHAVIGCTTSIELPSVIA